MIPEDQNKDRDLHPLPQDKRKRKEAGRTKNELLAELIRIEKEKMQELKDSNAETENNGISSDL